MTWVKPRNFIKFYYSVEPDEDGKWGVWSREFIDHTLAKPVSQHVLLRRCDTKEQAEAVANEFQQVSNR